jgi:hypothetical protein
MVAGTVAAVVLAGATGSVGYALGAVVGLAVGLVVGGVAGAVFGWAVATARPYDFSAGIGILRYVVDLTWSLPNTLLGAVYLTGNLVAGNRVERHYSLHSGCVQLTRGVFPRIGGVSYLTTIGTVIAGVAPAVHAHEHGHVLQARIFGPLYVPLVLINYVLATVVPFWWLYHDHSRYPIREFGAYFLDGVYPHVWNEAWCYRVYGPPR